MNRGIKFVAKVGTVAAFALGIAFASQVGASADDSSAAVVAAPSVSVTPSSGLSDGATVQVSASGLTPGETFFVGECSAVAATDYACNAATAFQVVADANGTVSAPLVVNSSFTGTTGSGATHAIDCKVDSCVVGVNSASFEGGVVPISFA